MNDIRLYCGVSEGWWNGVRSAPGPYACIAPVYGSSAATQRVASVKVPTTTRVIQDSGAFSDNWAERLTLPAALERQRRHAARYGYEKQITHRASYDLLIDEKWDAEGKRTKERWSEESAWLAVDTTVQAAEYLVNNRDGLNLILSAQGVSAWQYLQCVKRIMPLLDNSRDMLGLGGWCITGKMPAQMMPLLADTIRLVIPYAARHGVKRVHIWGVIHAPALAILLHTADRYRIAVSTDSAGPAVRPARGSWGYADWVDHNYQRKDGIERGRDRIKHVQAVRDWLSKFRQTQYYAALCPPEPEQMRLWA